MGKKDEYQFDYLDDNSRFADQINGALFHGRQIVKPDESQMATTGAETGTGSMKTVVDKVRIWKGKNCTSLWWRTRTMWTIRWY